MDNDEEIVIEARGLRKFFGGVQALRDASFTLRKAEVLAIVGANGAGKSTLLKILSGVFPPDEGTLRIGGEEIRSFNVVASRDHGIETVYQDLALVPNMDAAYNLFLGRPIRKWGVFADRKRMYEKTRSVLNDLGVTTLQDIGQPIEGLSGGQRQALAIGRAVTWGKGVVILDEPVAALGIRETEQVLNLILKLKATGVSILLVSHNLEHVFRVADRVLVMFHGRSVAEVCCAESDVNQLSNLILTGGFSPAAASTPGEANDSHAHS